MNKYRQALKDINKVILLAIIPICMDFFTLFVYENVFKTTYIPNKKTIILKLGIISTPPSIKYVYEDFPSLLSDYNTQYGNLGIINNITLLNGFLILSFILINSFLKAGYLACLKKAGRELVNIKDFFTHGNRYWFKLFVLDLIEFLPFILMMIQKSLFIFILITILFYYVEFSIIVDEGCMRDNFKNGIGFLFDNLGLTIKIMIYCGIVYSIFSLILFPLGSAGKIGMCFAMIIVIYFGMGFNKLMLEVYTEERNKNKRHEI